MLVTVLLAVWDIKNFLLYFLDVVLMAVSSLLKSLLQLFLTNLPSLIFIWQIINFLLLLVVIVIVYLRFLIFHRGVFTRTRQLFLLFRFAIIPWSILRATLANRRWRRLHIFVICLILFFFVRLLLLIAWRFSRRLFFIVIHRIILRLFSFAGLCWWSLVPSWHISTPEPFVFLWSK